VWAVPEPGDNEGTLAVGAGVFVVVVLVVVLVGAPEVPLCTAMSEQAAAVAPTVLATPTANNARAAQRARPSYSFTWRRANPSTRCSSNGSSMLSSLPTRAERTRRRQLKNLSVLERMFDSCR